MQSYQRDWKARDLESQLPGTSSKNEALREITSRLARLCKEERRTAVLITSTILDQRWGLRSWSLVR